MSTTALHALEPLKLPSFEPIALTDLPEKELLRKAIEYDEAALGELYDRYEAKIYTYMYRRISEASIAEDLTAQVFLKMLEAIRQRRAWHSSFSGWLYRIAHNLIIDHYRETSRETYVPIEDAPSLVATHYNPVLSAERSLQSERLRAAIRRLTDDQAQVVSLRFLERYSINEVARMLNKTEGAIKALQHRALSTLYQLLENEQLL